MGISFQVIDLRSELVGASESIEGVSSPEEAAKRILGIEVFRSGRRQDLVARVYWQRTGEAKCMVRLYSKPVHEAQSQRG